MSDLQQATVKLVLNALHSTNLTIEFFVMIMMAISVENPLSRSFFNGGIEMLLDSLRQKVLISVTVSNWVTRQAMKIYKEEMLKLTSRASLFCLQRRFSGVTTMDILSKASSTMRIRIQNVRVLPAPVGAQAYTVLESFPAYKA